MTENSTGEFKYEAFEKDIERISQGIEKYRELPGGESGGGQELVKKSIQSVVSAAPPPAAPAPKQSGALPDYASSAPPASKTEIEYLVSMALNQGLDKANAEAAKSSPFVMDAFHDALAAKLYPELKKRGIIK